MEIITKRFLIRGFLKDDESALQAYHSDPRYAEFCSTDEVTPESTGKLLRLFMTWATEHPRCNYQFAIIVLLRLMASSGAKVAVQKTIDID
jgi:hypothetical protein